MLLLLNWFIVCSYFGVKEIVRGLTFHMNTMKRVLCSNICTMSSQSRLKTVKFLLVTCLNCTESSTVYIQSMANVFAIKF